MTTILNLPDEILILTFEKVDDRKDLLQIQNVRRAWYSPARIVFLRKVVLQPLQVERFIHWIDSNPKTLYLNAVKSIAIENFYRHLPLDKTRFKKLLIRFPNLEQVDTRLDSVLDDETCDSVLKSCPKLKKFKTGSFYGHPSQFYDMLYSARNLVTTLDIYMITHYHDILNFLSNFHRLEELNGVLDIDNLQQIIPCFEQWPNMNRLSLECSNDDDGPTETKSKEEEDQLVARFSKVNFLKLQLRQTSLNTIMFVTKYMTKLTNLCLTCSLSKAWSERQQKLFCNYALDLYSSISYCSLAVWMKFDVFKEYLPEFVRKISASARWNVLKLYFGRSAVSGAAKIAFEKEHEAARQVITVTISPKYNLQDVARFLLKDNVQLTSIDKLAIHIVSRDKSQFFKKEANVNAYDQIIKAIPAKEVALNVPCTFEERDSKYNDTYPHVEKLTLRAVPEYVTFQTLLERCSSAFPNLKQLKIYDFVGVEKEEVGEYELNLSSFSIDSLTIDVSPFLIIMDKCLEDEFLVIKITTLTDNKCYLYSLPFDLSSVSCIQDADLQQFTCGEDYYQMHMIITSVQHFAISVYRIKHFWEHNLSEDYSQGQACNIKSIIPI